jgi:hypothetical protein
MKRDSKLPKKKKNGLGKATMFVFIIQVQGGKDSSFPKLSQLFQKCLKTD